MDNELRYQVALTQIKKKQHIVYLDRIQKGFLMDSGYSLQDARKLVDNYLLRMPFKYFGNKFQKVTQLKDYLVYALLNPFPAISDVDFTDYPNIKKQYISSDFLVKQVFGDKWLIYPKAEFVDFLTSLYIYYFLENSAIPFKNVVKGFVYTNFQTSKTVHRLWILRLIEFIMVCMYKPLFKKKISKKRMFAYFRLFNNNLKVSSHDFYEMTKKLGVMDVLEVNFRFTKLFVKTYNKLIVDLFRRYDMFRRIEYKAFMRMKFIDF